MPKPMFILNSIQCFRGIKFAAFFPGRQCSHKNFCTYHYFSYLIAVFRLHLRYLCVFYAYLLAMYLYVAAAAPTKHKKWICVASLVPPQHWLNFIHSFSRFWLLLLFFVRCHTYFWFWFTVFLLASLLARFHDPRTVCCVYHSKFSHNRQKRHSVEFFMIDSKMDVSF